MTGIQAGANISGDLKDPAKSIPKGTLLSLVISMAVYAVFVVVAGASSLRDASGNVTDLVNGTLLHVPIVCNASHVSSHNCHSVLLLTICLKAFLFFLTTQPCEYGLHNSYTIMQLMSLSSGVIYAGCWAATLSTALTNLLSVPRLIQALGIDRIYPGLIFFSKGYGKNGEPYRGYVLTFFISMLFLMIGILIYFLLFLIEYQ